MAPLHYISASSITRRQIWIAKLANISGHFGNDAKKVEDEIKAELKREGVAALLDHLRTCGALPENYGHDSSEEKLYSKYTDVLLSEAFQFMGLNSFVLRERSDAADVEAVGPDFSFVADAKAFRLSRTAKNQKDFKIEAIHGWKRAHRYALVVCPLYQLPARNSQIYMQATSRDVLILGYSHLAVLVRAAATIEKPMVVKFLGTLFAAVSEINQSKDAITFWRSINRVFLQFDASIAQIYMEEKIAQAESIVVAREEGLLFLSKERKRIMSLSHQEAVIQLIASHNIEGRMKQIASVINNTLFDVS